LWRGGGGEDLGDVNPEEKGRVWVANGSKHALKKN
jgi:hypothetical protein